MATINKWKTLEATLKDQFKQDMDKRDADPVSWNAHASALLYALNIMRQLDEPKKRHTTGYILPMVEVYDEDE